MAAVSRVPVVNALTDDVPPLPGPGRPADRPRAQGRAGRPDADLPRRRRQQHGALLPARRRASPGCTCGSARPTATTRTRRSWPGRSEIAAGDRRVGRPTSATRTPPPRAPTCSPPTPGSRWGRRARPATGRRRSCPYAVDEAALGRGRAGRRRAALPAGVPGQGDRRRGHRRAAERRVGRGGEPAARPEGAARLAAGGRVAMTPAGHLPRPPGTGGSSSCSRPSRVRSQAELAGCSPTTASRSPRRRCPATSTSSAR